MKVILSFHCSSRDKCIDLLEFLASRVRGGSPLITFVIRGLSVNATIFGSATDAEITKRILLNAYKEWRNVTGWMKHGKYFSIKQLMKLTQKPFPVEGLLEILRLKGIKVTKEGDRIVLDGTVSWEFLSNLAKELSILLEELTRFKPKASRSAKSLIVSYAYLRDISAKEALDELERLGGLKVEDYRVTPTKEWRSLLRFLKGRREGPKFGDRG